jgi:hypothetical protein
MVLDFRRLRRGEAIAGIAGVALIVALLAFKWFGIKAHDVPVDPLETFRTETVEGDTRNAFQSFTLIDLALLAAALVGIGLALSAAAGASTRLRLGLAGLVGVLGLASVALVVFRMIDLPDLEVAVELQQIGNVKPPDTFHVSDFPNTEVTRKIGLWLGLAASLALTYGGVSDLLRGRPTETR